MLGVMNGDRELIRELLDKVDALEMAVVAVVQAQDEETKKPLNSFLQSLEVFFRQQGFYAGVS